MKRGSTNRGFIIGLLLGLVLLFIAIPLYSGVFSKGADDLKNLRSCEGLVGALSGKDGGKCFPNKACTTNSGYGGVGAQYGVYWQYIGEGWGCPKDEDHKEDETKHAPYCCLRREESQNPLASSEIINEQFCGENTAPGELRIMINNYCLPVDHKNVVLDVTMPLGFKYFSDTAGACNLKIDIGSVSKTISASCEAPFTDIEEESLLSIYDGDPADLNSLNTIHVTLTKDGKIAEGDIKIQVGTPLCSLRSPTDKCVGQRVGDKFNEAYIHPNTGEKGLLTRTCLDKGEYRCEATSVEESKYFGGKISCSTVVDKNSGQPIPGDSICKDSLPIIPTCWERNSFTLSPNREPVGIYLCEMVRPGVCEQSYLGRSRDAAAESATLLYSECS